MLDTLSAARAIEIDLAEGAGAFIPAGTGANVDGSGSEPTNFCYFS